MNTELKTPNFITLKGETEFRYQNYGIEILLAPT